MGTEALFVVTAVAGATELIKRVYQRDSEAALIIAVAAIIGGVAGAFAVAGLTVVTGIMAGLSAAGVVTVATRVG